MYKSDSGSIGNPAKPRSRSADNPRTLRSESADAPSRQPRGLTSEQRAAEFRARHTLVEAPELPRPPLQTEPSGERQMSAQQEQEMASLVKQFQLRIEHMFRPQLESPKENNMYRSDSGSIGNPAKPRSRSADSPRTKSADVPSQQPQSLTSEQRATDEPQRPPLQMKPSGELEMSTQQEREADLQTQQFRQWMKDTQEKIENSPEYKKWRDKKILDYLHKLQNIREDTHTYLSEGGRQMAMKLLLARMEREIGPPRRLGIHSVQMEDHEQQQQEDPQNLDRQTQKRPLPETDDHEQQQQEDPQNLEQHQRKRRRLQDE